VDEQLDLFHLDRRRSLGALFNFEADTVTFRKALKTLSFDGAMVNKELFSAVRRDEPITFSRIEPLDSAFRHDASFRNLEVLILVRYFRATSEPLGKGEGPILPLTQKYRTAQNSTIAL
jgi:hypothetical protein